MMTFPGGQANTETDFYTFPEIDHSVPSYLPKRLGGGIGSDWFLTLPAIGDETWEQS